MFFKPFLLAEGIFIYQVFSYFFPSQQKHRKAKPRHSKQADIERSSSEDLIDSRCVQEEDQESGLNYDTKYHVRIERGIDE